MPIYEYVCTQCGEPLEKLQKLSDASLTDCPVCGESALKRKVSAAGFRLSGGGWYETDFKSANRRNVSGDKSDSSSDAGNGSSSGGDSQSADTGSGKSGTDDSKSASNSGKNASTGNN